MNMKKKRKQQEERVNVGSCKKVKLASMAQRSSELIHDPDEGKKAINRKKRKAGGGDTITNTKKLCKDKVSNGRTVIKDKQQVKDIPVKEGDQLKALSCPVRVNKKSGAKKIKEVQVEKRTKETDEMNLESKAGSTDSKKAGKKLNKWQRFKKKKDKQKTGKKDANKETKNVSSLSAAIENKSAQPVKSLDVSSNWKKLQQDLGLQPKKRKVHRRNETNEEKDKEEPEIWFDDVDEILLDRKDKPQEKCTSTHNPLVKSGSFGGVTNILAMDCEMVGVGREGKESMLARVSIVSQHGHCVYDEYVKPMEDVVDYRTKVSGIRKHDLEKGKEFSVVQKEVGDIIQGKILVGHAVHHDLQVLYIGHPKKQLRDTSRYKYFRQLSNGRTPSLKKLSARVLGVSVQEGEHSSVQDAQATMRLYTMYRKQWEKELKEKTKPGKKRKSQKKKRNAGTDQVDSKAKKAKAEEIIPSSLLERD